MKVLAGLIGVTVFVSVLFYLNPQIDLYISGLFQKNGDFILEKGNPAAVVTDVFHYGMRIVFFATAGIAGVLLVIGRAPVWLTWRKYLFVVLSMALAAGLMTNVVFKDHWGRARPNQIVQFGGGKQFTPAWMISDQCSKNCSFVGGDVSFAFCLLAPALLTRRRKLWVSFAVGFGTLIAVGRLAAGGHFLSDCVLAALLTTIVILALFRLMRPIPMEIP